ncbi:hypothetical protein VrSk94_14690 [Vibrio rotiferianus]
MIEKQAIPIPALVVGIALYSVKNTPLQSKTVPSAKKNEKQTKLIRNTGPLGNANKGPSDGFADVSSPRKLATSNTRTKADDNKQARYADIPEVIRKANVLAPTIPPKL